MSEGDYVTCLESNSLSLGELVFKLVTNNTHMLHIIIGTVEIAIKNTPQINRH